jgi:hypothetical protein
MKNQQYRQEGSRPKRLYVGVSELDEKRVMMHNQLLFFKKAKTFCFLPL